MLGLGLVLGLGPIDGAVIAAPPVCPMMAEGADCPMQAGPACHGEAPRPEPVAPCCQALPKETMPATLGDVPAPGGEGTWTAPPAPALAAVPVSGAPVPAARAGGSRASPRSLLCTYLI